MPVCPLVLEPIFKPKIWGGRKLATLLEKKLPPAEAIGESWECADLDGGQSVVARGPESGKTLHQLATEWGGDLLGRASLINGRFPLLIKFLDAAQPLSIQVHPHEKGAGHDASIAIKHEAWHILQAESDAVIYRGLRAGVTLANVRACLRENAETLVTLLNIIRVRSGDTFYLPAGTVHALGAGVVVAEVQTPSEVTYRLYDWGRTRPQADAGLHIDAALACIRTNIEFAPFEQRSHVTSVFTTVTRLVACPSFIIEKVRFTEGIEQEIPYAEVVCWIILDGRGEVQYDRSSRESFAMGDVVILPAALKNAKLKTHTPCSWLEVTIPQESDLSAFPRLKSAARPGEAQPGLIPLHIDRP